MWHWGAKKTNSRLTATRRQTVVSLNEDGSLALSAFFFLFCLWSAVNFWPKGSGSCLSPAGCVCVYVLLGQMVFVWAASDKVCINLVKIAVAGGAAGGSWWCLPAKRLTYVPGLKETIVIRWWVGGAAVCFFLPLSFSPSISEHVL